MHTTRLLNVFLLVLVALAACISSARSESPEPAIRIEPASLQASAGEAIQVTVEIRDAVNLGAFQFDLTYDPAIVQVDSIVLGDFPASTGRSINPLGPKIEAGKAVYGAFSFGDAAGPDGSGTLAIVTLKALAGGQTPLGLQNVQVVDVGGTRILASTAGATVTVSGTAPAPATAGGEPTRASTGTAETLLSPPQAGTEKTATSPVGDWAIVGAALIIIVALAALVARRMAR